MHFQFTQKEKKIDSSRSFPDRVVIFTVQKTTNRWFINKKHFTQVRVKFRLVLFKRNQRPSCLRPIHPQNYQNQVLLHKFDTFLDSTDYRNSGRSA